MTTPAPDPSSWNQDWNTVLILAVAAAALIAVFVYFNRRKAEMRRQEEIVYVSIG